MRKMLNKDKKSYQNEFIRGQKNAVNPNAGLASGGLHAQSSINISTNPSTVTNPVAGARKGSYAAINERFNSYKKENPLQNESNSPVKKTQKIPDDLVSNFNLNTKNDSLLKTPVGSTTNKAIPGSSRNVLPNKSKKGAFFNKFLEKKPISITNKAELATDLMNSYQGTQKGPKMMDYTSNLSFTKKDSNKVITGNKPPGIPLGTESQTTVANGQGAKHPMAMRPSSRLHEIRRQKSVLNSCQSDFKHKTDINEMMQSLTLEPKLDSKTNDESLIGEIDSRLIVLEQQGRLERSSVIIRDHDLDSNSDSRRKKHTRSFSTDQTNVSGALNSGANLKEKCLMEKKKSSVFDFGRPLPDKHRVVSDKTLSHEPDGTTPINYHSVRNERYRTKVSNSEVFTISGVKNMMKGDPILGDPTNGRLSISTYHLDDNPDHVVTPKKISAHPKNLALKDSDLVKSKNFNIDIDLGQSDVGFPDSIKGNTQKLVSDTLMGDENLSLDRNRLYSSTFLPTELQTPAN